MIKKLYRLTYIAMAAAMMAAQTSCANHDEPEATAEDLYVSLRLVCNTSATRATVPADADNNESWDDDYTTSEAESYESLLVEKQLLVTFYNADTNGYLGYLAGITSTDFSNETSTKEGLLEIRGMLVVEDESITLARLRTMNVKLMVTANMSQLEGTIISTDIGSEDKGIGSLRFTYPSASGMSAIPMWGVSSVSLAKLEPGTTCALGEVDLLRALAKVEVAVNRNDSRLDNVKIAAVSVNRVNTRGLVAPGQWNSIKTTTSLKFSETLRLPADVGSAADVEYDNADDDGAVIFYLPECENSEDDELVLTVNYTVGNVARSNDIYLRPYVDGVASQQGELWNVVRNHHYRYEITSVNTIKFTATVHDWIVVEKSFIM